MIIERVLNNNTIICLNEKGEELVIKGKGIAFAKKPGQTVDEAKIEKTFTLENKEKVRQYQDIIMDIPEEVIDISEEIIETIKKNTDKTINDKIYITLTDHISNLLERLDMGISFDSSLLWNVQALYPEEYQLAVEAVKLMKQHFDRKIPEDEANFIAIHIVNSEMEVEFQDTVGITETINQILGVINEEFHLLEMEEGNLDYARFVLHLRFLLQRIIQNGNLQLDKSSNMMDLLMKEYPQQSEVVSKIMAIISAKYNKEIDGERLFLLMHVIRLTSIT